MFDMDFIKTVNLSNLLHVILIVNTCVYLCRLQLYVLWNLYYFNSIFLINDQGLHAVLSQLEGPWFDFHSGLFPLDR